jgi:hypothetical protein
MSTTESESGRPSYRDVLQAYDRARDAYEREPGPHTSAILETGMGFLLQELDRLGAFELGQMMMTPGADLAMREARQLPLEFLLRHKNRDWGELPPEDVQENEWSLEHGARLFSSYRTRNESRLWVITEWDRRYAASPDAGSLPQAARSGGTI